MPDTVEQLQIDAKETLERGMACDRLVLRAIALGFNTRSMLKGCLGFGYPEIEKALERESGAIRSTQEGQIERFRLADENGSHPVKTESFNPFVPAKDAHITKPVIADAEREKCGCGRDREHKGRCSARRATEPRTQRIADLTCEKCGAPRSPLSGRLCRACYEGRNNIPANSGEQAEPEESEASPVGYIDEAEPEALKVSVRKEVVAAPTSVKIERVNSQTGARAAGLAEPSSVVLAPPPTRVALIKLKYGELSIECDTPEEAVAIVRRIATDPAPMPKTVKRAWSKDFEADDSEEGITGLCYLYLVSMLHDGMEENEKQAVWTLVLYLKRMQAQAALEREKLSGKKDLR